MILDDLLIHGDWLEENSIENTLYKQFLNLLRVVLRRNNQYGRGSGILGKSVNGWGFGLKIGSILGDGYSDDGDGNGVSI